MIKERGEQEEMGKTFKLDATLTPGGGEKERGKIGFKEPQTMMQLQENLAGR